MGYEQIRTRDEGAARVITLHRPDRLNAWTARMRDELVDALAAAEADDAVRAVVVTGEGRAFCAGADLGTGGSTFDRGSSAEVVPDTGGTFALAVARLAKPVIAAINGPAVGIGATMTLAMDIRLAAAGARFGFVFARRGIVPEACSTFLLPSLVGPSLAMEWVATGRIFDAQEALAGGLVRSVHAPDELLPAALSLVEEIASGTSPISVALARRMFRAGQGGMEPLLEAHRLESRLLQAMGASAEAREGVESFLEKRPARFPLRVSTDLAGIDGGSA